MTHTSGFSTTSKFFGGINNSQLNAGPGVIVTDILIRGGGGTITFSDDITVEFVYGFIPDDTVPGGGRFGITLEGPRAQLVYQNVLQQNLCDTIDWLLECSDLARRIAILELGAGLASQFTFSALDWANGTSDTIEIPAVGPLSAGQIGPHEFGTGRAFHVTVWKDDGSPIIIGVELELEINLASGLIILRKSSLAADFSGRVIIS